MMTSEQRYLFDVTGYLHLKNAITAEELAAGQEASLRYIETPTDQLPEGFGKDGKRGTSGLSLFDLANYHGTDQW